MSKEGTAMHKVLALGVLLTLFFAFTTTGYAEETDPSKSLEHYPALQTAMLLQLSDQTHLSGVTDVEGREQKGKRPPLSLGRIAGEIAAGWVGVFVGGSVGLGSTGVGVFVSDAGGAFVSAGACMVGGGGVPGST